MVVLDDMVCLHNLTSQLAGQIVQADHVVKNNHWQPRWPAGSTQRRSGRNDLFFCEHPSRRFPASETVFSYSETTDTSVIAMAHCRDASAGTRLSLAFDRPQGLFVDQRHLACLILIDI